MSVFYTYLTKLVYTQNNVSLRFTAMEEKPLKKVKEVTHVVNQMDIVLGHIEVYGSICSNEAKALYGIKNLKAVIHKIRSKMKVEIVNIYHTGTKRFYGYGINK